MDIILLAALELSGLDSASNRNEYQRYLVWGKGSQCKGLTTSPSSSTDFLEIPETSTSWRTWGLSRPVMG